MDGVLTQDNESDYTLNPDAQSVWITVDDYAVYIVRRNDGEVVAEITPVGDPEYPAPEAAVASSDVYLPIKTFDEERKWD